SSSRPCNGRGPPPSVRLTPSGRLCNLTRCKTHKLKKIKHSTFKTEPLARHVSQIPGAFPVHRSRKIIFIVAASLFLTACGARRSPLAQQPPAGVMAAETAPVPVDAVEQVLAEFRERM